MPREATYDYKLVRDLLASGMNCMRIKFFDTREALCSLRIVRVGGESRCAASP